MGTAVQYPGNELFRFGAYGPAPADETLRGPFRLETVVGGPVFVLGGISIGLSVTPVQRDPFIVEIGLYVTLGVNDLYLFPGIFKGNAIVVFILFQIDMVIVLHLELAEVFQLIGGCRQGFQLLLFYLVKKVLPESKSAEESVI